MSWNLSQVFFYVVTCVGPMGRKDPLPLSSRWLLFFTCVKRLISCRGVGSRHGKWILWIGRNKILCRDGPIDGGGSNFSPVEDLQSLLHRSTKT